MSRRHSPSKFSNAERFSSFFYGDTAIVVSRITDFDRDKNGETTTVTRAFDVWKKIEKAGAGLLRAKRCHLEEFNQCEQSRRSATSRNLYQTAQL